MDAERGKDTEHCVNERGRAGKGVDPYSLFLLLLLYVCWSRTGVTFLGQENTSGS